MKKAIRRMKEKRGRELREPLSRETVEIPRKKDGETERETRLRERAERLIHSASKRKPGLARVRKLGKLRGVLKQYSNGAVFGGEDRAAVDEDLKGLFVSGVKSA